MSLHVLGPDGHDLCREECRDCFGTGLIALGTNCGYCDGTGLVRPAGCECDLCLRELEPGGVEVRP